MMKPINPASYLAFALASGLFYPHTCSANSGTLATVQQQVQQLNLAEHKQWQALLHYQPDSLITDQTFFFHPNGAEDKQAELNATLAAFFQVATDNDNSPQCLFPARFAWLQQHLNLKKYLPEHRCEKLHTWLKNLSVTGITLVFPVAYLNNPASMFGHSFLRLDSQTEKSSDLMAWTVNYAAATEQERGVSFALKGLFGGYQGQYSLAPYYVLLKEYADLESRDLWEYTLNFSPAEQQRLLLHLWEIKSAHFDYYFINKNCSYQLLALLQAARPDLQLTEQFNGDAIPADTVRAVVSIPDLLKQVRYRPALATQVATKAKALAEPQQIIAKALAQSEVFSTDPAIKSFPVAEQARILELAFAYLSYLNADKIKHKQPLDGKLAYSLLTARSQLPTLETETVSAPGFRPDQGHPGNRLQLAGGYDGIAPYAQLDLRWSYHDLYDPAEGFSRGAQVEFFKPSLRYYPQQQRLQFESLQLININAMPAGNSFIQPFSWQVSLGVNRQRFPEQQRSLVGMAKAGAGLSYRVDEQTLLSVSGLGSLSMSDKFHQYLAIGFGTSAFGQHDFSTRWRIGAEASIIRYVQGITQTAYSYSITQRFSLSNNQALVLNLGRNNEFDRAAVTAQFAWQFYF